MSGSGIIGQYLDSNNILHGFLFDGSTSMTLDYPGGHLTTPYGISSNQIVGTYYDSNWIQRGFLLTIPEPATLALASQLVGCPRRRT